MVLMISVHDAAPRFPLVRWQGTATAVAENVFGALQSPVLNINGRTLGFEDRPASGLGGLERVRHGDVRLGTYPEAGQSAAVFRSYEDDRAAEWTPGDSSEPRGNGFFVVGSGLSVSGKPKARVPFVTFAGATDAIAPKGFFYVDVAFAAPVPFVAGDAIGLEMLVGAPGSNDNSKFEALVLDVGLSGVALGLRRADLLSIAYDLVKLSTLDSVVSCVCSQRGALASTSIAEWT